MSTRSYIGIKHNDQSFTFVYCHFDGYLEYNGVLLQEKYNDLSKVKDLISRGDMSNLEPTIDKIKFYNDDDKQVHYVNDSHLNNNLNSLFDIEFFYYFDESSSRWFYAKHNSSSLTFKPLETAIKPEMLESMAKYLKRS